MTKIQHVFKITRNSIENYVGLYITYDRANLTLKVDQEMFILKPIQKYGYELAYTLIVPTDSNVDWALEAPLMKQKNQIFLTRNLGVCRLVAWGHGLTLSIP